MVEVRNITVGYPGKTVLKNVSLAIPKGQLTVLLGPNGCGKSTLLKSLCGILTPENGQVLYDGEDLLLLPQQQLAQKIAYLSQGRQIPDITVRRLVLHGRFPYLGYPRRYRREDYACADLAMAQLGITDLADVPVQNLSGGQRQKVYIAMVLAQDTPIALLDEPTTYLDIVHQLQMMQLARELADRGKTVLMILHDLPHAFRIADKLLLMSNGTIAGEGSPEDIYKSGIAEQIFDIRLDRIQTDSGWHYYCECAVK